MPVCRVQIYPLAGKHIKKELSNLLGLNFQQVLLYDRLEKAIRKLNHEIGKDAVYDILSHIKEESFPINLYPIDTNE
jgi:hypothetical protein